MKPRPCSSHCRTCGRHFSGDAAFDKHRAGSFKAPLRSLGGRHCRDPEAVMDKNGQPWFESVPGVCRVSGSEVLTDIVIWRRRGVTDRFKGQPLKNGERA